MLYQIQRDTIALFAKLKKDDPDRYRDILDHECPDDYGLPAFMDTRTCNLHTCDECWKDALHETEQKACKGSGEEQKDINKHGPAGGERSGG